jgi:phage shock protein A
MSSLIARIREMVHAHAHHSLDEAENPDVMAQQVLRDLTDDIQAAQRALVVAVGAHKRLEQERVRLGEDGAAWDAKAEALLRAGNEGLAREALQRAVGTRAQAQARDRPLAAAQRAAERLRMQVDQLKRELTEAQIRAAEIRANQTAAEAAGVAVRFRDHYSRAMQRAQKMDRLAEKAGGFEAEADAASELLAEEQGLDREAERVTIAVEVDAAMAALKARIHTRPASS